MSDSFEILMTIGRPSLSAPPATIWQHGVERLAGLLAAGAQDNADRIAADYRREVSADPQKMLEAARWLNAQRAV